MGIKAIWLQDVIWKYRTVFFTSEWYIFFLLLQQEVIILDLGPENSFVIRKDKSFFNRNTCVQQEKITPVGVALGAVFIKKTRSNYPISPFGKFLSRNSKIALIITPKLLTCCKIAFFLASSEKYFSNKRNKKWARCTIDDRGWKACSLRCCVTFHLHVRFQVLERLPSIIEI